MQAQIRAPAVVVDHSALSPALAHSAALRLCTQLHEAEFDLVQAPLLRVALFQLAPERQLLYVHGHPLALDARSLDRLLVELAHPAANAPVFAPLDLSSYEQQLQNRQHWSASLLRAQDSLGRAAATTRTPRGQAPPGSARRAWPGWSQSRSDNRCDDNLERWHSAAALRWKRHC